MLDDQQIKEASEKRALEEQTAEAEDRIPTPQFIESCLHRQDLGDAELYKKLFRGHYVYNKSAGGWLEWTGHHWQLDLINNAVAAVEAVANVYQEEGKRLSAEISALEGEEKSTSDLKALRKSMFARAKLLRKKAQRSSVLDFVHTSKDPLSIVGTEIDNKPWLLACKNGVINLKTGELEPGRQEDYLLKASPVEWQGIDAPCPKWEKSLLEIFADRQAIVDCFQRVCGYALIGKVLQGLFIVMTGRGRNGKSTIKETILKIMGPLGGEIRAEMLMEQFRANTSGPTPDIMSMKGLRFACASEPSEDCRLQTSKVKWLTGNDTLKGRNPNDKFEIEFKPTHTLFLLTNPKPKVSAEDYAFWERTVLFPFDISYVINRAPTGANERKANRNLEAELEEELPGILAWMVRGCLLWQLLGVAPPAAVLHATQEYQRNEDQIADFIEECCYVDQEASAGATELYEAFEKWWKKNVSNNPIKAKKFSQTLAKRYEKRKNGTVRYYGIGLMEEGLEGFGASGG